MKDYRPLMILKERERAFLRNKPPEPPAVSTEHTYRAVSLNQ